MKKTYINPTLDVVEIKFTQQLLAGSLLDKGTDPVIDEGDVLAPGFGFEDEFDLTDNDDLGLFNN